MPDYHAGHQYGADYLTRCVRFGHIDGFSLDRVLFLLVGILRVFRDFRGILTITQSVGATKRISILANFEIVNPKL